MKRAVLLTIIIMILPALTYGSESPPIRLELPAIQWEAFSLDLDAVPLPQALLSGASIPSEEYRADKGIAAPDNMVSMASFLWAEITGSVDLVAEVRIFSREWRKRGRRARMVAGKESQKVSRLPDTRCRWKIVVGCRIEDNLELAARFDTRGNLLNEKSIAWQVRAADILPHEMGLTTVYRDGSWLLEADDLMLADDASVKVVVRF
jgi:hypothetical protein